MQQRELETKSAGYFAYAAARDAAQRSYAASTHYSEKQKIAAERMKLALEMMYSARAFHLNFRDRFIAIKLDRPTVVDRRNLAKMETEWAAAGVVKRATAQGIIYRIPKK
jgi:hypothetical protein